MLLSGNEDSSEPRTLLKSLAPDHRPISAWAGEEAAIEGRTAGADDYLGKPFSARELLARVAANLKLAQTQKDSDAVVNHRRPARHDVQHSPSALRSDASVENAPARSYDWTGPTEF